MSLRAQVLAGGRYLVLREGIGIAVRTAGVLLVTRIIGPDQYGLFAGSFFAVQLATAIATTGLDLFLNRRSEVGNDWYHQIFTCLLVSSVLVTAVGVLSAPLVGDVVQDDRIVLPLQALMLSIPLNILWIPARSKLERDFRFKPLTISEVGSDVVQYVLAVGLALAGFGVWAAVWGFVARQAFMLVSSYVVARYVPRLRWRRSMLREIYAFGAPMSAVAIARRAGDLVITVVVGRYLGASGMGVVALAVRLVDTASFVSRATQRVSVVALAKVQDDVPRLRKAVEEGMTLQVLAVGPVLVGMSLGLGWVVAPLLGERWEEVTTVVPWVAVGYLAMALLTTPHSALMVLGRRWSLALANVLATALFFAAAFVLVPRLGMTGYGLAMVVSTLALWEKNRQVRRLAAVSTRRVMPWFVAFVPLMFVPLLPWYLAAAAVLPLLVVVAVPTTRREVTKHVHALRALTGRGGGRGDAGGEGGEGRGSGGGGRGPDDRPPGPAVPRSPDALPVAEPSAAPASADTGTSPVPAERLPAPTARTAEPSRAPVVRRGAGGASAGGATSTGADGASSGTGADGAPSGPGERRGRHRAAGPVLVGPAEPGRARHATGALAPATDDAQDGQDEGGTPVTAPAVTRRTRRAAAAEPVSPGQRGPVYS